MYFIISPLRVSAENTTPYRPSVYEASDLSEVQFIILLPVQFLLSLPLIRIRDDTVILMTLFKVIILCSKNPFPLLFTFLNHGNTKGRTPILLSSKVLLDASNKDNISFFL